MKKRSTILQNIIRLICTIIIIFNIIIILSYFTNRKTISSFFSYIPVVVETKTSIKEIKKGDLIIAKKEKVNQYKKNDIVIFKTNDKKNIISKINNIYKEKETNNYVTKRNIKINNIQGKVIVRIPIIGYLIMFLQSIFGLFIFGIFIFLIYILYKKNK